MDEYRQVSMPRPPPGAPVAVQSQAASGPLLLLTDAAGARPAAAAPAPAAAAAAPSTSTALVLAGAAAAVQDVADAITRRSQPRGVAEESLPAFQRAEELTAKAQASSRAIVARRAAAPVPEPRWHAPWTLMRVISGHLGWVRCVAVDPGNEWFVTGAADRTIKFWDLASGTLKLTLTGHVNTVRALAVSARHPYLYSAGEDKAVKCWDLENNKVIRSYHGHLSGVYSLALHPTLDLLFTVRLGLRATGGWPAFRCTPARPHRVAATRSAASGTRGPSPPSTRSAGTKTPSRPFLPTALTRR